MVFGFLLFPTDSLQNMPEWLNKLDLYIAAVLVAPLLWQLVRVFKKTGIEISPRGIEENIVRDKKQTYPWSSIQQIKTLKILYWNYLLIYITDPKDYIRKQNIFLKLNAVLSHKRYGTPIKIPTHRLSTSTKSLIGAIGECARGLK